MAKAARSNDESESKPNEPDTRPFWNESTQGALPDDKADQYQLVPPAGEIPQLSPDGTPVK